MTPEVETHAPDGRQGPLTIVRRLFLHTLIVALGGFAATIVGIPVIGALLGPRVLQSPRPVWRTVGTVDHFVMGQTVEVTFLSAAALPWGGVSDKTGAWLRREDAGHFVAFALYCQHLVLQREIRVA